MLPALASYALASYALASYALASYAPGYAPGSIISGYRSYAPGYAPGTPGSIISGYRSTDHCQSPALPHVLASQVGMQLFFLARGLSWVQVPVDFQQVRVSCGEM